VGTEINYEDCCLMESNPVKCIVSTLTVCRICCGAEGSIILRNTVAYLSPLVVPYPDDSLNLS